MRKLDLKMTSQPDYTSCGPTSLFAVYKYWEHSISFRKVLSEITQFEKGGGTLGVILARHALLEGFKVTLYTYNLHVFDPTWFHLSSRELIFKLNTRLRKKKLSTKAQIAIGAYIKFLEAGGTIKFMDMSPKLIRKILKRGTPVLTGLSSTWLYQAIREVTETNVDDDIEGDPAGHFVVLYGYNQKSKMVNVADPYRPNPINGTNYYKVNLERLITSILLGVMTYDGNLVAIEKDK